MININRYCESCQKIYSKPLSYSYNQWSQRRFCSNLCAQKVISKNRKIDPDIEKIRRMKISKTSIGHLVSKNTREKIGLAHKGKKISEEHKKKISEFNKKRKIGEKHHKRKKEKDMKILKNYRIELAKTLSQHWYSIYVIYAKKGKKEKFLGHFSSVTTYLNAYPTSEQLTKWVADNGFHESRVLRDEAGRKGTKIHSAIEDLFAGNTLYSGGFTTEEFAKIKSFVDWHAEYNPEIIATEMPIFSKKGGYAGTVDCIAKIGDELCLIDWKSSKSIHNSFYLQIAAYANAVEENTDLKIQNTAILQLGAQNKNGYRFVLEPDWKKNYKVFLSVRDTWLYDNGYADGTKEPPILDLPNELKL